MHILKLTKTQLGIGGARFRYEVRNETGKVLASFDDSRAYVACLVFQNADNPRGEYFARHFTARPSSLTVRGSVLADPDLIGVALIETANYGRAITRIPGPVEHADTSGEPIDWGELPAWYIDRLDLDQIPDTATPKSELAAAPKMVNYDAKTGDWIEFDTQGKRTAAKVLDSWPDGVTIARDGKRGPSNFSFKYVDLMQRNPVFTDPPAAPKETPAESLLKALRGKISGVVASDDPAFVERLDDLLRPFIAKAFLAETFRLYLENHETPARARGRMIIDLDEITRAAEKTNK
jgi:hypothetical protein